MKEILLANPPLLYLAFISLAGLCGFLVKCLWSISISRVKKHEESNKTFQTKMNTTIENLNTGIGGLTQAITLIPIEVDKKLLKMQSNLERAISSSSSELHEKINETAKDLENLKGVCTQRGETCLSKHPRVREVLENLANQQ